MTKKNENKFAGPHITRRDFVNNTLIGSGAALLAANAPSFLMSAQAQAQSRLVDAPLNDLEGDWTGPGGTGDYAGKNGNTASVVNEAHSYIRNGSLNDAIASATQVDDVYDLIVVGAGISGLTAANLFLKQRPDGKVLVLDQHAIFGGEAKRNEYEIDGYTLMAPQGATEHTLVNKGGFDDEAMQEVLYPTWSPALYHIKPTNTKLRVPLSAWATMLNAQASADQAWYFEGKGMVVNPWENDLADTGLPENVREGLLKVIKYSKKGPVPLTDVDLDSMTYRDFLLQEVGVSKDAIDGVCAWLDPHFSAAGWGRSHVNSAYALKSFNFLPGVGNYGNDNPVFWNSPEPSPMDHPDNPTHGAVPGGNALLARCLLKAVKPEAIEGDYTFEDLQYARMNWDKLDLPDQKYRLRLSSTVFEVKHNDTPEKSTHVFVTYGKEGKMFTVRGKRVVCAGQQHANRRICKDLSPEVREAMQKYHHYPVLVLNVILRNWRFLEKLGAPSVRWFDGENTEARGWHLSLYRAVVDGSEKQPMDPDKPYMLTMWNPIFAGEVTDNAEETCTKARMTLFAMPFSEIEAQIVDQFTKMFAPYGFDAKKDIAGIIANRQGHAYQMSPPGKTLGKNGKKSPQEILQEPFHRIAFSHAELNGSIQIFNGAMAQAKRAVTQLLPVT